MAKEKKYKLYSDSDSQIEYQRQELVGVLNKMEAEKELTRKFTIDELIEISISRARKYGEPLDLNIKLHLVHDGWATAQIPVRTGDMDNANIRDFSGGGVYLDIALMNLIVNLENNESAVG